jgi:hypothetical protein
MRFFPLLPPASCHAHHEPSSFPHALPSFPCRNHQRTVPLAASTHSVGSHTESDFSYRPVPGNHRRPSSVLLPFCLKPRPFAPLHVSPTFTTSHDSIYSVLASRQLDILQQKRTCIIRHGTGHLKSMRQKIRYSVDFEKSSENQ